MKMKMFLMTAMALGVTSGCSRMEGSMNDRNDRAVAIQRTSEPANWEIRGDSPQAKLRTESESTTPATVVNLPPAVRAAAEREASGEIESAEFYEAGDSTVYVVSITDGDAPHELTIRHDGVVLLNRRNPATRQIVADEPTVTVRDWNGRE